MAIDLFPSNEPKKKVFKLPFAYHATQASVVKNPARFKIIRCGRKWGKTTLAQKKALDWLGPPNSCVWFCSPTYKQSKLISWTAFKRLIPPEALGKKPNDTDLVITLKNGSELYLMGSDDPDTLRGPAPTGLIMEEAAFHDRAAWHEVLRPNLMPTRAPAIFIGTPKGFNWFKDLEDEALKSIRAGETKWAVFHYTVFDNPYISREEIEDCRKDCDTPQVWRQEYLAEFESSVGRVFAAFDGNIGGRHIRKVILPNSPFDAWRAIDWGMRDNTACLWGRVKDRVLYVYREYLANNLPPQKQAEAIKNQTFKRETILNTAISHDAAKQDPAMKGLTVEWHFFNSGIKPLKKSTKNKQHSRSMIQQLIHENRIVIDPDCVKLIKQLLSYEWKDTTMEKVDDTADDDAVDALHYLVEMLQFELFLGSGLKNELSEAEIYAEIAKEKLAQRTMKYDLPSVFRKNDDFGDQFENTTAGYF